MADPIEAVREAAAKVRQAAWNDGAHLSGPAASDAQDAAAAAWIAFNAALAAVEGEMKGLRGRGSFDPLIHVPGVWRCAKCNFRLIQSNLNALDGTVTARDEPGEPCPNCGVPLWRVTWREEATDALNKEEQTWKNGFEAGQRRALTPEKPDDR